MNSKRTDLVLRAVGMRGVGFPITKVIGGLVLKTLPLFYCLT
jgi:hypothetical protein